MICRNYSVSVCRTASARAGGIDIGGTCCPIGKRSLGSRLSAKLGFGAVLTSVGATLLVGLFTAAAGTPAATAASTTATTSTTAYTLLPGGPQSLTGCSGTLARDPQGNDWYDYTFNCAPYLLGSEATGNVLAFALVATRQNIDGIQFDQNNIQGNGSPTVSLSGVALTNETVTCNTDAPSDGFNCTAGAVVSTTGGATPAYTNPCTNVTAATTYTNLGCIPNNNTVSGQIQLSAAYCSYIPKGAKAGTPAVPRAEVNLVVTDDSGAEDGPFELTPAFKCAKVKAVVPAKKTTKPKKKKQVTKTKKSKKGAKASRLALHGAGR